jgi:RHS repeat-associated protein
MALFDSGGNVKEKFSYDAWGRRRNPSDWTYVNVPNPIRLDRGFTGHEHYEVFKLIDMNGRVYDPVIGRFLSPDPFIQSPDFTQSYNNYSYCLNNPLKFTDLTGYSAYNDPWTDASQFQYVSVEQQMAALFGGQYYDLLPYSSSFAGAGKPDEGGNGDGSAGIYYDYKTGKWRSTDNNAVIDPKLVPGILLLIAKSTTFSQSGEVMLQNEKDGFFRIWSSSFSWSTEYGALVTPNGLITFHIGKGGGDLFGGLTPTWKENKCYVDFKGNSYQVLGSVHVHWDTSKDAGLSWWDPRDGSGDESAAYYTLKGQIPIFVLGWDNKIHSFSYKVNYTDYLSNYNVNSLFIGNLSIIRMLR